MPRRLFWTVPVLLAAGLLRPAFPASAEQTAGAVKDRLDALVEYLATRQTK